MLKPADLRQHLTAAVPQLARDPEKLVILARGGRIASTGTAALAFEYAYTLQVLVLDYTGHADAIVAPLLIWLRRNQGERFDNPATNTGVLRFDVEYLNDAAVDLSIEMDLTERVLVRPRDGAGPGALNLIHPPEPAHVGWIEQAERWRLYFQGEPTPIAEWTFDPRPLT